MSFGTLLVIYIGIAIYFANHYYYGSVINDKDVSGETVKEVKEQMSSQLSRYTLTLMERDGKSEQIGAVDIGLKYSPDEQFKNLKDRQKSWKWITMFFDKKDYNITVGISYDKSLLEERLNELSCFDSSNIVEPKNPNFQYKDNSYVIIDEVNGNKVNKGVLYEYVVDAILRKETTLDLESMQCYVKPQYTSESPQIVNLKNKLNRYVSSKITYTFGKREETIDASIINKWVKVDENLVFTFDEEKAKKYIDSLLRTYNTLGKVRNFVTSSGKTVKIKRGDYGWLIDTAEEVQEFVTDIKEGRTVIKEPAYIQKARTYGKDDIGDTYVEIDITKQHLWFYKNGSLIVQGDVVTGNVSAKHSTPAGIYRLKYKARHAVLRGPDYSAPVDFWMPFNGGIGIHDANWRSRFGGKIYKTNGSHGCINSPYNVAKAIFNNISPGVPIICYY